jgi:hypothetical protein
MGETLEHGGTFPRACVAHAVFGFFVVARPDLVYAAEASVIQALLIKNRYTARF